MGPQHTILDGGHLWKRVVLTSSSHKACHDGPRPRHLISSRILSGSHIYVDHQSVHTLPSVQLRVLNSYHNYNYSNY